MPPAGPQPFSKVGENTTPCRECFSESNGSGEVVVKKKSSSEGSAPAYATECDIVGTAGMPCSMLEGTFWLDGGLCKGAV